MGEPRSPPTSPQRSDLNEAHTPRSQGAIFRFWVPLAATWLMMAAEGPVLAAVIARLPDATFNLAAYGVMLAVAFLVESPVVMLMTASTALAEDRDRYRRLRTFAYALNAGVTGVLLLVLVPPVFDLLVPGLVGVPDDIARLTYGALWILLPWPAAIGYRRFYQGLLIRDGRTRLVAVGTVVRLVGMTATALALYHATTLPGAFVGAAGLTVGVSAEAIASRVMARKSVARVLATPVGDAPLYFPAIVRFYIPLALTSLIGFAAHPMLTFFMGRAPEPIISLAVFPVVNALACLFRSVGLAFQEAAIALMGDRFRHLPELRRFALTLGLVTSAGLALVALTPLAGLWFVTVSGLTPELAAFAILPTLVLFPVPFLSVFLSLLRAVQVMAHETRPITVATILEVGTIASVFPVLSELLGVVGVTAAAVAFLAGRTMSVSLLTLTGVSAVRRMGANLAKQNEHLFSLDGAGTTGGR